MPLPVHTQTSQCEDPFSLGLNPKLVTEYLVEFLRDECIRQRGITTAVVGLSGGIDSAVTTALCVRAFGPERTECFRLPYRLSSQASLDDAQRVIDQYKCGCRTLDITSMVDGYLTEHEPDANSLRVGNVCARARMTILFDQSAKLSALPIGTGNKTERLFGYYTWHADDTPPINPLGDLYKSQVIELAKHLEIPAQIIHKPASADLVAGQTDEGDFGITYAKADVILNLLLHGFSEPNIIERGYTQAEVQLVKSKVSRTHWKRKTATVAMLSDTAINENYLRPVDYRGF